MHAAEVLLFEALVNESLPSLPLFLISCPGAYFLCVEWNCTIIFFSVSTMFAMQQHDKNLKVFVLNLELVFLSN